MEYSTLKDRWPWKIYILGLLTTPAIYLFLYFLLRLTGVFHAFYNQGGWEIDGSTGIYVVDVPFFPLTVIESDIQNKLRWLKEPAGG